MIMDQATDLTKRVMIWRIKRNENPGIFFLQSIDAKATKVEKHIVSALTMVGSGL